VESTSGLEMRWCAGCGHGVEDHFRYCPRCGEPLRSKIVEYFQGEAELGDGGLRASVYLNPPQHVRFSIWQGDEAKAAISLEPSEVDRLVSFLQSVRRTRLRDFESEVRRSVRALAASVSEVFGHRD
jgi:hypothetical protein